MAGIVPASGDGGDVGGGVEDMENLETGFGEKTFVFSGRAKQVIADRTARGDFLMRNDSADDERITKDKTRSGFEDAGEFTEQPETGANVAQNVVGEGGVERRIGKGGAVRSSPRPETWRESKDFAPRRGAWRCGYRAR